MKKITATEVRDMVAELMPLVLPLIEAVGGHPEVGYEEVLAAELQEKFLTEQGFRVEAGAAGKATAFLAEYEAVAAPDIAPAAIFTEYDALPAPLGHACGHQLIMGSGLLALAAARRLMERHRIPGKLLAVGSPAEEQQGGKVELLNAGCLDGVGAAFLSHPFYRTGVTRMLLAVSRFDVEFFGRSAHASTNPAAGVNALDAMNLFFAGLNAWRQQLPATARVHGIITEGGKAANVIPDYTAGFFYVRSMDNATQQAMERRFADIVQGAALMTGCQFKLTPREHNYTAGGAHPALAAHAEALLEEFGMPFDHAIEEPLSTDFGNVCDRIPGVNLFFDVTGGAQLALHSLDFKAAATDGAALAGTADIAAVLTRLALDYLTDPALRAALRR